MVPIGARRKERKKKKVTIEETPSNEETAEETATTTRFKLIKRQPKDQPPSAKRIQIQIMLGVIAT